MLSFVLRLVACLALVLGRPGVVFATPVQGGDETEIESAAEPEGDVEEGEADEFGTDLDAEDRGEARVAGDVEARESVYLDTDHTQISTTSVDLGFVPGETGLTFSGGYVADVISAASVDVVSAATPVGSFTELRNQGTGNVALERGKWVGSLGYTFSDENDWTSHTGSASLGRDFRERTTNITGGYVFVHNQVFRAADDNFREQMITHAANLTLTQVLGKKTTSRLSGFFGYNDGFQSSPYRYVPVGALPGRTPDLRTCDGAALCPLERVPRLRLRSALAATVLHYIGRERDASIRAVYRFYGDSWEVFSHTLTLAYTQDLGEHWQLRARTRTYFQDKAFFYEERYARLQRFMSVDRELSTFIHQLSGAKLTYKTGLLGRSIEDLRIDFKADVLYFKFFDFVRLPQRVAGILEVGIRLIF